jgi:hypothetical protein
MTDLLMFVILAWPIFIYIIVRSTLQLKDIKYENLVRDYVNSVNLDELEYRILKRLSGPKTNDQLENEVLEIDDCFTKKNFDTSMMILNNIKVIFEAESLIYFDQDKAAKVIDRNKKLKSYTKEWPLKKS